MKDKKNYIYISLIIIFLILIIFILLNTVFYNYKSKLNNYLDIYYIENSNDMSNINKILSRYKNNDKKTDTIIKIIEDNTKEKILLFNSNYDTLDDLENKKNNLVEKITNLYENINLNYDNYINQINKLYESKTNYLKAITFVNENNCNEAYNYLNLVIENDSYFSNTISIIDSCFNSEINNIINSIDEQIKKIDEQTNVSEQISIYKNILDYVVDKEKNISFDITKSKIYNNKVSEILNKLLDCYIISANKLKEENKYSQAIEIINEGISLLSEFDYNASKLIELKDEYNLMLPVSLTSLESIIDGKSIKEEMAITDNNNKTYSKTISFYDNSKGNIVYKVNKEYKYLSFDLNISNNLVKNKNYGKIKIYFDNKVVFTSNNFNTKFTSKSIKLDLNDINEIKIEYTTSSNNNILVAMIGNPMLEKY